VGGMEAMEWTWNVTPPATLPTVDFDISIHYLLTDVPPNGQFGTLWGLDSNNHWNVVPGTLTVSAQTFTATSQTVLYNAYAMGPAQLGNPIPTMGTWGIIGLMALMGGVLVLGRRRLQTISK